MSNKEETLTDEDCRTALENYMTTKDIKLISFSIKSLSGIEGFSGQYFKVNLKYENSGKTQNVQCFLKILSSSVEILRYLVESTNAYEKEDFFYQTLMKEFTIKKINTSFAPKCYLCRPYLILLEDLSQTGYRITQKKNMFDVEHCKIALKTLAKFHASGIVYEEIKSTGSPFRLIEAYPANFERKLFSKNVNAATRYIKCTLDGVLEIINFLPENEISADDFKTKLHEAITTFNDLLEPSKKFRNTFLHSDVWSNNIMFRYENETPVEAVLIDYQLLNYGPPAADVVQLIVTNVRRGLRTNSYDELLMCYYDEFCQYLKCYGIKSDDILTLDDFLKSCDEFKVLAKTMAISDHSVRFLMDEVIADAFKDEDSTKRFLFLDRSLEMKTSYHNNELYREILQEDLFEIRDLLVC